MQLRLFRSTQPPILDSRGVQPQIVRARHQGLRTPPASLPAAQATVHARLPSLPSLLLLAFPPLISLPTPLLISPTSVSMALSTWGGSGSLQAGSGHATRSTAPSTASVRQWVLRQVVQKTWLQPGSCSQRAPDTSSKQMGQHHTSCRNACRWEGSWSRNLTVNTLWHWSCDPCRVPCVPPQSYM